jgi:cell division inhibitor SulA
MMLKEVSIIEAAWRWYKQYKQQLRSVVQTSVFQAATSQTAALPNDLPTATLSVVPSFAENVTPKQLSKQSPKRVPQQKLQSVKAAITVAVTDETKIHKPRPMGTLTEIRSYSSIDCASSEEDGSLNGLQQLLPALAGFCRDRWLVLVSPPRRPNIAELTAAGIDPARVLLVHADASNRLGVSGLKGGLKSNGLKIVEQALRSGNCGAVLAWLQTCDVPTLQRLRRAAVAGQAWGVMFREGGIETESEGEGKRDLTMQAEQRRFVPSNMQPTKPLAEKMQRSMAQVVSIHCGSDKPSDYVSDDSAGKKTETVQLEMAIS